jgi:hypothetical protein
MYTEGHNPDAKTTRVTFFSHRRTESIVDKALVLSLGLRVEMLKEKPWLA